MHVKKRYESHRTNEARMLHGNNYSYKNGFAEKSGRIGDLRLYDDGKMTFTSYQSTIPSATWKFKDLDVAKDIYFSIDFMLLDLGYGNIRDEEFADYLSRQYPNLRVEAVDVKYEGKMPFKITDIKCDRRWVAEVSDHCIIISCKINGVPCQFPFGAARWGKLVGGLGIDCAEVLFREPTPCGRNANALLPVAAAKTIMRFSLATAL